MTAPETPTTAAAALPPPVPRSLVEWILLWFTLRDPVGRKAYAITGFGLMLFKYAVEAGVLLAIAGHLYTPLDFVNPLVSMRAEFLRGESPAIGLAWIMWSLPFLWIAISMSIRRAYDAGISPWNGFWVLVPIVNLFAMLILAGLPTRVASNQWFEPVLSRIDNDDTADPLASVYATIGGIAIGALYATVVVHGMTTIFRDYSGALFFGTPFITGVAAGYLLNLRRSRSVAASIMVGSAAVLLTGVGLLLFALEGVICLMMAAPIMLPLGMAGGPCGKFLADRRRGGYRELLGALVVVPLVGGIESQLPNRHEFVVASSIDIAAPPEVVWQQVIAFPEINEPPEWFFRLGISCPTGAQIEGTGVGATRECLFTTGKFVEPITAWEPPRRLAFDVREQPEPMFELTPYRDIHPPHLEGAFRSTRGEFELVPLDGGRTRLIGRTWYTLDIRPLDYWSLWTDEIIHRIHLRVLRHIGRLAEQEAAALSGSPLTL